MALVTLSIPNEKLSLFGELLNALGIEESNENTLIEDLNENSVVETSKTFFKKYFDWEYNKNELEFE